jgi:hypothetical protein
VGEENLNVYITEYYKKLFGIPVPNNFSIVEENNQDIPPLSPAENGLLTTDFMEKEVFAAIYQMEHNKAPGLEGFLAEFYQ